MKKLLRLKAMLLLCALIAGSGSVWAADVVETLTIKGWGNYTTNSYGAAGTDYTGKGSTTGVSYAMQVFNGQNGMPRGNQSTATSNFSCRNTDTYKGYYIKQVQIVRDSGTGTLDGSTSGRSVVYFGTSAYSNPKTKEPTGTATSSTENKSSQATLTWENSDKTVTYFILYNLKTSSTFEGSVKVTWASASSDPEIEASNVAYDGDETSGEIAYTINNPVEGKVLTASTSADWITLGTVTSGKVPFTMTENTGALREGTITLTYKYGDGDDDKVTKAVTVTQKAPVVKYNVDINATTNGSVSSDFVKAEADTLVTLTITPSAGYKLTSIAVIDSDDADVELSGTGTTRTFTMPAKNVTVSATFVFDTSITYDFSFEKMGTKDDANNDWGGSYASHTQQFSAATVTFSYASKQSGTITDIPVSKGYSSTGTRYVSLKLKDENVALKSASFALRHWTNKAITITMYYSTDGGTTWTTTGKTHAFTSSTNGENVTLTAESLPAGTNAVKIEGGADQQYGIASATIEIISTVTLAAACTDGAKYYGTYSNDKAFVVPADLTVSAVKVTDGVLAVSNYSTGDVVKAGTGVMVASAKAGDHTVVLTEAAGTELDGNMLKASSVAMEGNNKYYRLTMHNGETIGFWWGAAEGGAFSIAANKAYLAVPEALAREGFAFDFGGETTGITSAAMQPSTGQYYDLQGRRVAQPTKGLYIVNGRKVVIR